MKNRYLDVLEAINETFDNVQEQPIDQIIYFAYGWLTAKGVEFA